MEKKKVEELFAFLSKLYPKAKEFTDKDTVLAWSYVLEPFEYSEVRAKVSEWARSHDYPPRVSEITAGLVSPSEQDEPPKPERSERNRIFAKYARQLSEDEEGRISVSRYARQYGLSWEEAKSEMLKKGLCVAL